MLPCLITNATSSQLICAPLSFSRVSSPPPPALVASRHYLSVVRGQANAQNNDTIGTTPPANTDGSWAAALPSDIDALFVAAARLANALAVHGPQPNAGADADKCRWPLAACHNDLVLKTWRRRRRRSCTIRNSTTVVALCVILFRFVLIASGRNIGFISILILEYV